MRRTVQCLVCLAAAVGLAAPVLAAPADDLLGTWECYVPGAPPTKTPPIVWFGPAQSAEPATGTTVDLDGFARTVYGLSEIVPDAGGWLKIQPKDGEPFLVQAQPPYRGKTPAMTIRRANSSYNCLRLPKYS